ncbi:FAD-dependent oxidoreductase [Aspergillus ibericus CBS 121593]|uniref:FAD/NAD(P)-binding domain-containing protein n=1 Tax=Aspergillus ibericus CBS 121593 TaxID=1448316 RepID=A0A395GUX7_9EURO|nr:FAD/NAD(P)-binding domain-containing protein [Aspergillus ibericus CBS 121593]RAK99276.1 FAD/NAD(P)-binding domain-containing protein [Aspergillus ibericus CBS 121593]
MALRVIIVGGSIAGLTLAHSLRACHIDYLVLEAKADIAPAVGASIGILPNGARILDQLGIWPAIGQHIAPLHQSFVWSSAGRLIVRSDHPRLIHERHAYPFAFLDRRILLKILYEQLGLQQERVHLNKRVVRVGHVADGVVAHCEDGSVFAGDLVVGADGVRSTVLQEMRRQNAKSILDVGHRGSAMQSEYSCLFGISNPVPGLHAGDGHFTYAKGYSTLTVVGKDDRVFWFLFTKMSQSYDADHIPRFTEEDLQRHVARYGHVPISDTVPLSAVSERIQAGSLHALEEAFAPVWTVDRIACVGDAIHKMTPNIGQGGNSAIETVAALANHLASLRRKTPDRAPSLTELKTCLQTWQTERHDRAHKVWSAANAATRMEAGDTLYHRIIGQYMLPYLGSYLTDGMSELIKGAEKLDFLPVPARSLAGSIPYTSEGATSEMEVGMGRAWFRWMWVAVLVGAVWRLCVVCLVGADVLQCGIF